MKPETLRRKRRKVGLSQRRLATLLGVSRRSVNRWERSGEPIPKNRAISIQAVFKALQ